MEENNSDVQIVLTQLAKSDHHEFRLEFTDTDGEARCIINCNCGFKRELFDYKNYCGLKELENTWKAHIENKI
jgi:hypothetical protein